MVLRRCRFLLVFASLFLFLMIPSMEQPLQERFEFSEIRSKGLLSKILIYRLKEGHSQRLEENQTVNPGDLLQISYISTDAKYGIILSIDHNHWVTLHYPTQTHLSTQLQQGKEIFLNHSYELDDAPNFERFYFITSNQPINIEDILNIAKQTEAGETKLKLPSELKQMMIHLKKGNN